MQRLAELCHCREVQFADRPGKRLSQQRSLHFPHAWSRGNKRFARVPREEARHPRSDSRFSRKYLFRARPLIRGEPRQKQTKVEFRIPKTCEAPVDQPCFLRRKAEVIAPQIAMHDAIPSRTHRAGRLEKCWKRILQPLAGHHIEAQKSFGFSFYSAPPVPFRPVSLFVGAQCTARGVYLLYCFECCRDRSL